MATDLERLVVRLEAQMRTFEREMQRGRGTADRQLRAIENRFQRANRTVAASISGLGRLAAGLGVAFSAREAIQLSDAATRITNALRVAGLEGEALGRVYDRLYESAQKNATPLETLVTLYSRAARVQNELGASSEEILRFTDRVSLALRAAGTDAAAASGALLQLSQALGSGVVRAEEFNSILEGAPTIAQAAAAGLEEAGGSVAKLRKLVADGEVSSKAFFRAFEAGSVILEKQVAGAQLTVAQGFTRIQNAVVDVAKRMNEGSEAGAQLANALDSVARAIRNADFSPLISEIATFIDDIRIAYHDLIRFKDALSSGDFSGAALALGFGRTKEQYQRMRALLSGQELTQGSADAFYDAVGIGSGSGVKPVSNKSFPVNPDDEKKSRQRLDAFQREIRQIEELTRAQQLELRLVGQSEYARDRARAALELENAARRAGITDIESQRSKINQLSDAYAQAADAVRRAEDQQERLNSLQREFGDLAIDSINGLIDGTKTLNDVLADTLKRLADMVLQAALLGDGPLGGLFGNASSGRAVGGLIGALFGGFRAAGGPVKAGRAYVVGENGPELFRPSRSGMIVPNDAMGAGGGRAVNVTLSPVIDARGAAPGVGPEIVAALERKLLPRVVPIVRNAAQRGMI